jgi:uncharacterized protein DUF6221
MDELVRWLGEQLDADERIARAVEDRSAPFDGQWIADGNSAVRTLNGHVLFYRHDSGPLKLGLVDHVVAHDPSRVLRETAAKRQLLDDYVSAQEIVDATAHPDMYDVGRAQGLEEAVRRRAEAYADRPGFKEEWRP